LLYDFLKHLALQNDAILLAVNLVFWCKLRKTVRLADCIWVQDILVRRDVRRR
jgi:hypothetical protein